jgi:hypothetical protein
MNGRWAETRRSASEKLKSYFKKIIFGYVVQTARERNVKIKCRIVKTNAIIFKYGGRNVE